MATDTIGSVIIMIGVLIIVSVLVVSLLPGVLEVAGSIRSSTDSANDRVTTSAMVINHELGPGMARFDVLNNGKHSLQAPAINLTVACLDNATVPNLRLTFGPDPGQPWWGYAISGAADGAWDPGDTLVVTITSPNYDFTPGDYRFRMLLYNGAWVEHRFNVPE